MLSTQNVNIDSQSKGLTYGNQFARINGITMEVPSYDLKGGNDVIIRLHLESPPIGNGFQGFPIDQNNPNGAKYEGQVAGVKLSQYTYRDGQFPDGTPIRRDEDILKALAILARTLGKKDELDAIRAATIEEYIPKASAVLRGPTWLNFCIGAREYVNKNGYNSYDLYLPRAAGGRYPYELSGASPSKLLIFDKSNTKHFQPVTPAPEVNSFAAAPTMNIPQLANVGAPGFPAPAAAAPAPQYNAPAPQQPTGQSGFPPAAVPAPAPQAAPAPQQQMFNQQPPAPAPAPAPQAPAPQPQAYVNPVMDNNSYPVPNQNASFGINTPNQYPDEAPF